MLRRIIRIPIILLLLSIVFINFVGTISFDGLHDFGSLYASARAIKENKNPYSSDLQYIYLNQNARFILVDGEPIVTNYEIKATNLNPPFFVLVSSFVGNFNPYQSVKVWRFISGLFFLAAITILSTQFKIKDQSLWFLWVISVAGIWQTITIGQIYAPMALLVVMAYVFEKNKRPILTGLCIGILTALKPNFGVWIFILFAGKSFKTALSALFVAGGLSALPIFFFGPEIFFQWLEATRGFSGLDLPVNNSLVGLFIRIGIKEIGTILSIFLVVGNLIIVRLKEVKGFNLHNLGIMVSLLASPIAWPGYTTFLVPAIWLNSDRKINITAAAILSIPIGVVAVNYLISFPHYVVFGWLYGWAIILLLISELSILKSHPVVAT